MEMDEELTPLKYIEATGKKDSELNPETIAQYVEGCSEIGVGLHTVVEHIKQAGKKPIVLIPSRGAVPIFLLAHEAIRSLDPSHFLLDHSKVGYYPKGIFSLLSGGSLAEGMIGGQEILNNKQPTETDIILYPFTADVSAEQNGEEWLARRLRESCARAFCELVFKNNEYLEDLEWYYFLMNKTKEINCNGSRMNPKQIVDLLRFYPKPTDCEIVLIDTVISGRASQDIITAFAALDQRITPLLAVDTRGTNRFQAARKAEIERTMSWEYMGDQHPFIEFPLITEDKGAAFLGVSAVNFSNFNKPGFFRSVDNRFKHDFLPQSCIWSLPPSRFGQEHLNLFHKFLDICIRKCRGEEIQDLPDFVRMVKPYLDRQEVDDADIRKIVQLKGNGAIARETASHIVSVKIPDSEAQEWIHDFASYFFPKTV